MKRNTGAFAAIVIAIASLAVARICLAAAEDKSASELIGVDDDWSNAATLIKSCLSLGPVKLFQT